MVCHVVRSICIVVYMLSNGDFLGFLYTYNCQWYVWKLVCEIHPMCHLCCGAVEWYWYTVRHCIESTRVSGC